MNTARVESINSSGQKVVHCDKQPHPHEPIDIIRSDGAKHDLNVLTANADLSDIIEKWKAETCGKPLMKESEEREHSHIKVRRSDGVNHDIINVFQNKSDSRGVTMKLTTSPHRRSQSINPAHSTAQSNPEITLNRAASASSAITNGHFWSLSSKSLKPSSIITSAAGQGKGGRSRPPSPTSKTARRSSKDQGAVEASMSAATFPAHYFPKHVRIVHISDTHNLLQRGRNNIFLPSGDILVHSGNFSNFGSKAEYDQFNDWLGVMKGHYHYRIVCIGARDVKEFGNNWDVMRRLLPNATHVLCHNEAIVLGIRFYAVPWHWAHHTNYNVRSGAPATTTARFDEIPDGTQVLITHGPAFGALDLPSSTGSKDLADAIRRVKPAVHLHGHVKGTHGVVFSFGNWPLVVNSALTDPNRQVLYATAHVVKATQLDTPPNAEQRLLKCGAWQFSIDNLIESS